MINSSKIKHGGWAEVFKFEFPAPRKAFLVFRISQNCVIVLQKHIF